MRYYHRSKGWREELVEFILIFVFGGLFQEGFIEYILVGNEHFVISEAALSGSFWVVMWKGSEYIGKLMDKNGIGWSDRPLTRFTLTLVITLIYIVLAVTILNIIYYVMIGDLGLWQLLGALRWSNFNFSIYITFGVSTFMHGRTFLMEWRQTAIEMERFKNESLKSQYESLKNQVNPHFLFNSLNALSSLVYDDQDKAVDFIRKLSQVYRYVLDNKDMELVSIQDELQFLNNYLFLQKIRFGDNLILKVIDQNKTGLIPPLGLQLLVENAIKHNIVSEKRPLTITVYLGEDFYSVSNNIQEKLSKDSTGIGLNNLKSRYDFLTDEPVMILNENNIFEVRLPIITIDKSNKDK